MEPKLLGEMAGSKPGTGKIEMHFKHFLLCIYSKNDRGVLKGYRSQLEGAKTGTTYILIFEQQSI